MNLAGRDYCFVIIILYRTDKILYKNDASALSQRRCIHNNYVLINHTTNIVTNIISVRLTL